MAVPCGEFRADCAGFEARLERTARSIPAAAIKKALGSMRRRIKCVIANHGDWVTGD